MAFDEHRKCAYCGRTGTKYEMMMDKCVHRFRQGWNGIYCSKDCEIRGLKALFSTEQGANGLCSRIPDCIQQEIDKRWEDLEV